MPKSVNRFEIWLVELDPTVGSEIRKTRPCVIVSPEEMNRTYRTVVVAPMTTSLRKFRTRANIFFAERDGQVALDQIRAVDRSRLIRRLGVADAGATAEIINKLAAMFAR
jgi:mRNA interferase MazF